LLYNIADCTVVGAVDGHCGWASGGLG